MIVSPSGLIAAIAAAWEKLEQVFQSPAAWELFSGRLLQLLRNFDDPDGDQDAIAKDIVQLFTEHAEANAAVNAQLAVIFGAPGPDGGLGSPWSRKGVPPRIDIDWLAPDPLKPAGVRHTRITVLYGTDRGRESELGEALKYSTERADSLSLGAAIVAVPDDRGKGDLPRPHWYQLDFRENPDRHVVLLGIAELDREDFIGAARAASREHGTEALVFVHGYNVSFADAIRRTAQLATDLEFPGIPLAYSWPSGAKIGDYAGDANVSGSSMFLLADFIRLVRAELGVERVHVIAHSMGGRLVAPALDRISHDTVRPGSADIHQLVFAAPDIDPLTFERFAATFLAHCQRCTLYASTRDLALGLSQLLYGRSRAGKLSPGTVVVKGVDTIDATRVDSSLVGHSYFGDRRTLLADLFALLKTGDAPGHRFGLREVALPDARYWELLA